MKAIIYPSKVEGSLAVPSSKSLSHRALICAGLSQGQSQISSLDISEDIKATIRGLEMMGAKIEIVGSIAFVTGISQFTNPTSFSFDAFESGTTLRLFIPLISLFNQSITIKGSEKLLSRPLQIYQDLFKEAMVVRKDHLEIKKKIVSGNFIIPGNVSSQFISGLLYTLPLLEEDSYLQIVPPFESQSYLDLTLMMLAYFNIKIKKINDYEYFIKGQQKYQARNYKVEGDYSQAAFFMTLGLLNNDLKITKLNNNSLQGDQKIIKIIKTMNGEIYQHDNDYIIKKSKLSASIIDLGDCPDLGPILMVLASQVKGQTVFKNTRRLRFKESDRLQAMQEELAKYQVQILLSENEALVKPHPIETVKEVINCHNDHRICMAMSILATISVNPIILEGVECINKSYPLFFNDLKTLGVKIELYE